MLTQSMSRFRIALVQHLGLMDSLIHFLGGHRRLDQVSGM